MVSQGVFADGLANLPCSLSMTIEHSLHCVVREPTLSVVLQVFRNLRQTMLTVLNTSGCSVTSRLILQPELLTFMVMPVAGALQKSSAISHDPEKSRTRRSIFLEWASTLVLPLATLHQGSNRCHLSGVENQLGIQLQNAITRFALFFEAIGL